MDIFFLANVDSNYSPIACVNQCFFSVSFLRKDTETAGISRPFTIWTIALLTKKKVNVSQLPYAYDILYNAAVCVTKKRISLLTILHMLTVLVNEALM